MVHFFSIAVSFFLLGPASALAKMQIAGAKPGARIGGPKLFHSFEGNLGGPPSPYTERLIALVQNWPMAASFCPPDTDPAAISMVGIRTPDRPYFVGFKKCMLISAPMANVEAVLDDEADFPKLFSDIAGIKVVLREKNFSVLEWERTIPLFFFPNLKYRIAYVADKSNQKRLVYRYQFLEGDRLKLDDGIEVLEKVGNGLTRFTNYEFYEADYGFGIFGIQGLSAERVWRESLKRGLSLHSLDTPESRAPGLDL